MFKKGREVMKQQIEDLTYLGVIVLAIAFLVSSVLLGKNMVTNVIFVIFTLVNIVNLLVKSEVRNRGIQAILLIMIGLLYFM